MSASSLPDEIWRQIFSTGISACNFTYKDLCCIGITGRRFSRLSGEDEFWSVLLHKDFPCISFNSANSQPTSKSLYRIRFERDKERKLAAHKRAVLRTESLVRDSELTIQELESKIRNEVERMRVVSLELSNLRRVSQATTALNVWQPEMVRRWHKQTVEQGVVTVSSRISGLEMEVKLCKKQISIYDKAHKSANQRLEVMKQQLAAMKYHPVKDYYTNSASDAGVGNAGCSYKWKKLKRKIKYCKEEKSLSSPSPADHDQLIR